MIVPSHLVVVGGKLVPAANSNRKATEPQVIHYKHSVRFLPPFCHHPDHVFSPVKSIIDWKDSQQEIEVKDFGMATATSQGFGINNQTKCCEHARTTNLDKARKLSQAIVKTLAEDQTVYEFKLLKTNKHSSLFSGCKLSNSRSSVTQDQFVEFQCKDETALEYTSGRHNIYSASQKLVSGSLIINRLPLIEQTILME